MLRVLQVSPAYYPATRYGGPIRSIHGLAVALRRRGHEVHVVTTNLDGAAKLDVPLDRSVEVDGVCVRYFDVPWLPRLCHAPGMRDYLKLEIPRFDVIHLQSVFLWPTYVAARIAEAADVPYLISPRGMLVADLVRRRSSLVKRAWIRLVERRSLARAAAIHSTSELESMEARNLCADLPRVFCVPNGVEVPVSAPALSDGPFAHVRKPYALFLSRISWKKGIDRLLHAWSAVPDLHLVIAGNDDEGLTGELRELAVRLGVESRVSFVGPADDMHKWALYREARMFVLPSYSENFGNVVAEAMAAGCPVVVTPEVGLAALVASSGSGVVTPGDHQDLAQAVNRLRLDDLLCRRMGEAGRRSVESELSWGCVAEQFERLYLEVSRPNVSAAVADLQSRPT